MILTDHAGALANYPHARRVGQTLYVSGCSSRRADNTHAGVTRAADGTVTLDIREQTRGVIENLLRVVRAAGGDARSIVDVTTFLVEMADYAGYNEVYDTYFDAATGPARTTVAVRALPHPHLLIEIKAIAVLDR
ncbi:MAG: RidA family protein [Myxococcales bacterium]|nr:RidA family protein [Myxococcales bacterium]MCB9533238.1 RidA family protein [Myxococcales bacterium]